MTVKSATGWIFCRRRWCGGGVGGGGGVGVGGGVGGGGGCGGVCNIGAWVGEVQRIGGFASCEGPKIAWSIKHWK